MEQTINDISSYYKLFVSSFIEINSLLIDVASNCKDLSIREPSKSARLISTCKTFVEDFKTKISLSLQESETKIIKKIYKSLRNSVHDLIDHNKNIFSRISNEGLLITIIPGVDIGLVYDHMNSDELTSLWQHLQLLFIASTKLIMTACSVPDDIKKALDVLEEKLALTGISVRGLTFNPFIGTNIDQNNTDISLANMSTSLSNVPNSNAPSIMSLLPEIMDVKQLDNEIKNLSSEDIEKTTENISNLFGADEDVKEVCSVLVKTIVSDFKENGLSNFCNTIMNVSNKTAEILDASKLKKTANAMNTFFQNSDSTINNNANYCDQQTENQNTNIALSSCSQQTGDSSVPMPLNPFLLFQKLSLGIDNAK